LDYANNDHAPAFRPLWLALLAVFMLALNGFNVFTTGGRIDGVDAVILQEGRDVNIGTSQDTSATSTFRSVRRSGLLTSGLSIGFGTESSTDAVQASSLTNNASLIGSVSGNVNILAEGDVSVRGSEVAATRDLNVMGRKHPYFACS
jgi:filamentous hemagglutinin